MKITGIDMADLLKQLSPSATWFIWTLEQNRMQKTNISSFTATDIKEKRKVRLGYKELHSKEIIKRTKRTEYIINPKAILPNPISEYDTVWQIWQQTP